MKTCFPRTKWSTFPVYESISKSGRADYKVIGFLSARICAYEDGAPIDGLLLRDRGFVATMASPNVALTKGKEGTISRFSSSSMRE